MALTKNSTGHWIWGNGNRVQWSNWATSGSAPISKFSHLYAY